VLDREEYVEQAHLFAALGARFRQGAAMQEELLLVKEEILSTTKLFLAIDFLAAELKLIGMLSTAMAKLRHYFTPFQAFVIGEAESERGRFEMGVALKVLEAEAKYKAEGATQQGLFVFDFECLSRNRLGYDRGLAALAEDPLFDAAWRDWILTVRRQVGIIDFADMVYVRSELYVRERRLDRENLEHAVLFGEKEGRIAKANRRKDPLMFFAALQRQLGYPAVPRNDPADKTPELLPLLMRRIERLEAQIKLLEEEQRGGIDLSRFMKPGDGPPRDVL
jgi:hypothetical protein